MKNFSRISSYIFYFLLFLSNPQTQADESIKELVELNCVGCHLDPNLKAPSLQAMSWATSEELLHVMNAGKMKTQSSHLSEEQKKLIAGYISSSVEDIQVKKCKSDIKKTDILGRNLWGSWGVDYTNKRNQTSSSINSNNINSLMLRWALNVQGYESRSPPVVLGSLLIIGTSRGFVYALNRETGCSYWRYRAEGRTRNSPLINSDDLTLYIVDQSLVVHSVNLLNGKLNWKSQIDKEDFQIITGSPVLHGEKLIIPISSIETAVAVDPFYECCKSSGAVVALNRKNGEVIWYHRVLDEAKFVGKHFLTRVEKFAPAGASVWGTPAIDDAGKKVFFGTAQSTQSPASEFSDAIVALDMDNGRRIWSHQTVPNDAHNVACEIPFNPNCPDQDGPDLDFGAAVIYLKTKQGEEMILAGQKSGWVYAFNPENGKKIWSKRLGRGGKLGGVHWGMALKDNTLFVPISDRTIPSDDGLYGKDPSPGIYALDIKTGDLVWSSPLEDDCKDRRKRKLTGEADCFSGFSAPISISNDLLFAGALDGRFFAYSVKNGERVWEFDTLRDFAEINAPSRNSFDYRPASGGSIDAAGPVILDNWVFTNSGFGGHNQIPGNVLLAFSLE